MSAPAQGMLLDQLIQVFWTPYDPLDLASGSLDPLGFTRGYLALADRFLPSFTTVTTVPRYVSMLCAALATAQRLLPQEGGLLSSKLRQERLKVIKSFERGWALACGLAARDDSIGSKAIQGLRGIRSVTRRLDSVSGREKYVTTGSFNLLANQLRYGGMGVYSTFLEETHLASMNSLSLRPLGQALADLFPAPESMPVDDEDAKLSLDALREWGSRAHTAEFTKEEGKIVAEALRGGDEADHADHVRWSTLRMLARLQSTAGSDEGQLLLTLAKKLDEGGFPNLKIPGTCQNQINATLQILEPFERLYQGAVFLFDSVRGAATDEAEVSLNDVVRLEAVEKAATALRRNAEQLLDSIQLARTCCPTTVQDIDTVLRDSGILSLVADLRKPGDDTLRLIQIMLNRHNEVQARKFDKGLPKAPWFHLDSAAKSVRLTAQRNQLLAAKRPPQWTDEGRHPYRTYGAFNFIEACGIS